MRAPGAVVTAIMRLPGRESGLDGVADSDKAVHDPVALPL